MKVGGSELDVDVMGRNGQDGQEVQKWRWTSDYSPFCARAAAASAV